MMTEYPHELVNADFSRIRFALDFTTPCELRPGALLRLRRPLRTAARQVLKGCGEGGGGGTGRLNRLFDPALSHDPVAIRTYQKPSPPFVIRSDVIDARYFDAGDRLELEVLFLGAGIPLLGDFLLSLAALGEFGLVQGEGRFEVTEAAGVGIDGEARSIWPLPSNLADLVPEVFSLATYLQDCLPNSPSVRVEISTPARLMSAGRPLKSPSLQQLFPFMLRRVTSMLHAHCGLDVCRDPALLLEEVSRVQVIASVWQWQDWRDIGGNHPLEHIGGVVGTMTLQGPELDRLLWVIGLSGLFGIGKGAPYGAGQHCLTGLA